MKINLAIDESKLDRECVNQPEMFHQAAVNAAEARKNHEELRVKLDATSAELDRDIRTNPEKYDLEKVTEISVANCVLLQSKFQKVQKQLIQARYELDLAQAVVTALEHRKKSLENLAYLIGQDFNASPKRRTRREDE